MTDIVKQIHRYDPELHHKAGQNPYVIMREDADGSYCDFGQVEPLIKALERALSEREEALKEADAFDMVAAWHEKNAVQFKQMANDDPRTGELDRLKAIDAAKHHAGSAASLHIKASDIRRAHYAAIRKMIEEVKP